jgi:uncharacterized protein
VTDQQKFKRSRYNHFVPTEDGKRLAFNAMSCGLAEMDQESYEVFEALASGNGDYIDREKHAELIENLRKGGFLIDPELDELAAIRAAHYKARFGNRGFGLTIIPTLNCNFACDYCYERPNLSSVSEGQSGIMSDEVCSRIVKLCEERVEQGGKLGVTWYGGEPLLAPQVIENLSREFIRICDERNANYSAGIITNGYLLDEDNMELLRRCEVGFAQVTIDGPREIHDKRRPLKSGGGTYERIIENLMRLPEDSGLRIAVRINVDKRNGAHVEQLLQELQMLGMERREGIVLHFGHVFAGNGACPDMSSQCMVTSEFSKFLVDVYRSAVELGFKQSHYPKQMLANCGAVGNAIGVVEPNGNLQACWETVGQADKRTGVLDAAGVRYESNSFKWLGWTPFVKKCASCDILPLCMRGCPYRSVYDGAAGGLEKCISWRYNLLSFLPVMKTAHERKLLATSNEA